MAKTADITIRLTPFMKGKRGTEYRLILRVGRQVMSRLCRDRSQGVEAAQELGRILKIDVMETEYGQEPIESSTSAP